MVSDSTTATSLPPGSAQPASELVPVPLAVVMLTLDEAHNMDAVLENLHGWASEVLLVDSYSSDDTVDIALKHGVHVVQRKFRGFGDQWNFALQELPITAPWTMKLDPDERLTDKLKLSIAEMILSEEADVLSMDRRLWFMGQPLPLTQRIVRVWRTGSCKFTDVEVNEYPIVHGNQRHAAGYLEHHDSPNLDHWIAKQNRYSTSEARAIFQGQKLADDPRLFGTSLQRRMWMKRNFWRIPFRYVGLFFYHYLWLGAWRAGWVGYAWSRLRTEVYRLQEFKYREMRRLEK